MIKRCFLVERAHQRGVLCFEIVEHPGKAALDAIAHKKQDDHHYGQQQHHKALKAVGKDVGVGTAHDHIDQKHRRCNDQRPAR